MHHFLTITEYGGGISNLNRDNPTPKPLNSQEDLLKNTELNNQTTPKPTHLSPLEQANLSPLEQANAEKYELILKTKHKTKL